MSVQPHIDRGSHVPYYLQLKEALTEGIERGDWGPGDLIPSEAELGKSFGVSRTVVRQALNEMTFEGLVVRQKGKGTFVSQPKISSRSLVQSLEGFYSDMADRGVPVMTQVLEQTLEPADLDVATNLELEAMAPVVKLIRLRFVEEEPIVLVESHLPYEMCRDVIKADLEQGSLYAFLEEECGLTIGRGWRRIEAVAADEEAAARLGVDIGSPLIRLKSVSYTPEGTPLEYFDALFRGDRSRFEVEIVDIAGHGEKNRA
ncbi:MAG: GntR family transcriptional regulator [Anaerolineales bacterium]